MNSTFYLKAKTLIICVIGIQQRKSEVLTNEVVDKKDRPTVSAIDFVGLGFADKKEGRGLPAGLIPISDSFSSGDLPDVEIIVGDISRFEKKKKNTESNTTTEEEEDSELYKPKVSTWGVFPRPNNISKTVRLISYSFLIFSIKSYFLH